MQNSVRIGGLDFRSCTYTNRRSNTFPVISTLLMRLQRGAFFNTLHLFLLCTCIVTLGGLSSYLMKLAEVMPSPDDFTKKMKAIFEKI